MLAHRAWVPGRPVGAAGLSGLCSLCCCAAGWCLWCRGDGVPLIDAVEAESKSVATLYC